MISIKFDKKFILKIWLIAGSLLLSFSQAEEIRPAPESDPLRICVSPLPPLQPNNRRFIVEVENRSSDEISGKIQARLIDPPPKITLSPHVESFRNILPHGSASIPVRLQGNFEDDRILRVEVIVTPNQRIPVKTEQIISFYPCRKIAKEIRIDGDPSEWDSSHPIRVEHLTDSPNLSMEEPESFHATLLTGWDREFFYFAAEVIDPTHSALCSDALIQKNDGLKIFFDSQPWKTQQESEDPQKLYQYGFFDSPEGATICCKSSTEALSPDVRFAFQMRNDLGKSGNLKGFIWEGAIPFQELGLSPRGGKRIGFNVEFIDNDKLLSSDPVPPPRQISWTGRVKTQPDCKTQCDLFLIDPLEKGQVQVVENQTRIDGKPFFPFGFWTFGQSEAQFHHLEETGSNTIGKTFEWNLLEPQRNQYDFKQLQQYLAFLDLAYQYGQKVIVQCEIHPEPEWLFTTYPGLHLQRKDRTPTPGGFMKVNFNHPGFRMELKEFLEFLIPKIQDHPAVLAYSPWNEPSWTGDLDHSSTTRREYRKWSLKQSRQNTQRKIERANDLADLFRIKEALEQADSMPVKPGIPMTQDQRNSDRESWLSWMQFRQEFFADFFQWYQEQLEMLDPNHPMTLKQIWKPLDSRYAWASATNYERFGKITGVVGSDPYPHPHDFFINRWICDWNRSASMGKPCWFLEYNRAFVKEQGQMTPEEVRSWFWESVAHGMNGVLFFFRPMQPFDPDESDNAFSLLYADTLEPLPAAREIQKTAHQLRQVESYLAGAKPVPAQVAILHDWNTLFQMPGDLFPTAGATTLAQMFYRSHIPVDYISEQQVKEGILSRYRVLGVAGTVASDEETLRKIEEFHAGGGALIATARFGERDENFTVRKESPPAYFGVRVSHRREIPREKRKPIRVRFQAIKNDRTSESKTATRELYSSTALNDSLQEGSLFGFEDMILDRETLEQVEVTQGSVIARFPEGTPAVIEGERTLYIAKDLSYSGDGWRRMIRDFALKQGVRRPVTVTDIEGRDAGHVDAALLQGPEGNILIVVNAPRLYEYDGSPEVLIITLEAEISGDRIFDLLGKQEQRLQINPNNTKKSKPHSMKETSVFIDLKIDSAIIFSSIT